MNITFDHISMEKCPHCNSGISSVSKETHSNGLAEYVVFTCGAAYNYAPNFGKVRQLGACQHNLIYQFVNTVYIGIACPDCKEEIVMTTSYEPNIQCKHCHTSFVVKKKGTAYADKVVLQRIQNEKDSLC